MEKLQITYRRVEDLVPYVNNARTHSRKQISRIVDSIKKFGFTNPILTDGENGIIAGHGRIKAAKKLGMEEVPTIELSGLTDSEKRAYIIADNKLALDSGWDEGLLKVEFDEIKDLGEDFFESLGLDEIELPENVAEKALSEDITDLGKNDDRFYEDEPAILTYRNDVLFKTSNDYDIPELREDMLYDGDIDCTATKGVFKTPEGKTSLYVFGVHGIQSIEKNNVIGFFVEDHRFEKVFENSVSWLGKFYEVEPKALCTPNFSFYVSEPLPFQLMSWYKTMWCGRYWQEAGFKVIPTLNWGAPRTWEFCFTGIPKGAPVVICEFRCAQDAKEQAMAIQGLLEAKRRLDFGRVIIYGVQSKVAPFYDTLKENNINFSVISPWSESDKKGKV